MPFCSDGSPLTSKPMSISYLPKTKNFLPQKSDKRSRKDFPIFFSSKFLFHTEKLLKSRLDSFIITGKCDENTVIAFANSEKSGN